MLCTGAGAGAGVLTYFAGAGAGAGVCFAGAGAGGEKPGVCTALRSVQYLEILRAFIRKLGNFAVQSNSHWVKLT